MEGFITWEALATYTTFVTIVFAVVEFIKELGVFKKIQTKYLSFLVSLLLMVAFNLQQGTFVLVDIVLYILSAIIISLGANGLSNFNNDKLKDGVM